MMTNNQIVFNVDTGNVIKILASDIYDSPLALLRENLQNAYDAVRMRLIPSNTSLSDGRIDIEVHNNIISITDNGIGMTESVLRENFWKAGSSGKRSEEAKQAGVVGTFGIGAMANFGVCTKLVVRTRPAGSDVTLTSSAERDKLKIAEECIELSRSQDDSPIGTTIEVTLDSKYPISPEKARKYLDPYICLLPVPVFLNGELISKQKMNSRMQLSGRGKFTRISLPITHTDNLGNSALCDVWIDQNGQILIQLKDVKLGGVPIEGFLLLLQSGGQLMGLRSYFGLAAIPCYSVYQFGGFANLSFLQPTAGREAISRSSIDYVSRLISIADRAASESLATSPASDKNTAFMQWVVKNHRFNLAGYITIRVLPEGNDIQMRQIRTHIGTRTVHYYAGSDPEILQMYSGEGSCLLQLATGGPRRTLQQQCMQTLAIAEVPDSAQVIQSYENTILDISEVAIIVRIGAVLRDDYLVPDVKLFLSDISHGVQVLPINDNGHLIIHLSRTGPLLLPIKEVYRDDYQIFLSLMKDFVRNHIYPRIQKFVPSSTRQGVDALRRILERNRELYSYEENEAGELEKILGDLVPSNSMDEVLRRAQTTGRGYTLKVTRDQVGTVENVLPDVASSVSVPDLLTDAEYTATPPILREEITSDMKILVADEKHPQLNNFSMLLGLSDKLMREYSDFFHTPHTTRIMWGGHRVIYIFTEATGRLSLYYDVELRESLESTSGAMFPTTTVITKKRIFVPIPDPLLEAFKITTGTREFFVRFDILTSGD